MIQIKSVNTVSQLNKDWDTLTNCIYKKKTFLKNCEKFNYCNQEYYQLYQNGRLISGAIVYTLKLNIFTYSLLRLNKNIKIVGIPCSVSENGFIGDENYFNDILNSILKNEKGFVLILNLDQIINNKKTIPGKTLPSLIIEKKFDSFENYMKSIKKNQRRRIKKIIEKGKELNIKRTSCIEFNKIHYSLYENVFDRSKAKLEKLNLEFFKNLPAKFPLNSFYYKNKLVAWHITFQDNKTFYFFLGGIDYDHNKELSCYFNLTVDILKLYILSNCSKLDLGQTAEIPKMYIGGKIKHKYMLAHHSNPITHFFIKKFKHFFEYKYDFEELNIFK